MPPPPDATGSYLEILQRDYAQRAAEQEEVRRLRREIEKKKLEQELADLSAPNKPSRKPIEFYGDQLAGWFNSLPTVARQAPRSMEELLSILKGRSPGMRPHAGDLSKVLIREGWKRKRHWKADGEGRRLWYPPSAPPTQMSYAEK